MTSKLEDKRKNTVDGEINKDWFIDSPVFVSVIADSHIIMNTIEENKSFNLPLNWQYPLPTKIIKKDLKLF